MQSAKSGVLVASAHSRRTHYLQFVVTAVGMLCVLVGVADVTSRLVNSLGPDATFLAFAPAAAINNNLFITPARLKIPSLGINAAVEFAGIKADGTMDTPKNFDNVAWYSPGSKPGEKGSAVFAGHVNNALFKSGVFERLSQIKSGDYVTVEDSAGKALVYRVSSIAEYQPSASTDDFFTTTGPSRLVLITCDGDWVPAAHSYDKRLVVIAEPAY